MVLPYLNYCNVVWCTNKPTQLNVLVVLQQRIIRTINNGRKYDNTLPLFSKSKQLKLVGINKLSIATFMYRACFNQLPQKFSVISAQTQVYIHTLLASRQNGTCIMPELT